MGLVAGLPGSATATCVQAYSTVTGSPHMISASYGGDPTYTPTGSNVLSETVVAAPTANVVLTADQNPVTVGQNVTYTATVSGSGATPTGSVNFSDGSSPIGSCQNVGLVPGAPGTASATCVQAYSTVAGSPHMISASYGGDPTYAPTASNVLSEAVVAAGTSTALTAPPSLAYGAENATPLSVTVSTLGAGTPTGTVAITSGSTNICSITLSGGTGSCTLGAAQLDAATYPLSAIYTPDTGDFSGSSTTGSLTVVAAGTSTALTAPPSLTYGAENATPLSVTVSTLGAGTPTGTVAIKSGSTTICSITLSGGRGNCTLGATQLDASTYPLTATYTPDTGDFAGSSTTGSLIVNPAGTSTQLTVPASLTYGAENAAPLWVTVSTLGAGVPTGTVAITSGSTNICSITLSAGTGSCTLGAHQLNGGTYPLTATYSPDTADLAGSSTTGTLTIGQRGTVLVAAKATFPQPLKVHFSATLTSAGTPVPGETITFSYAGVELCTATTNAQGVAGCTVSALVINILGPGSYDAGFAGDQNYLPSSGSAKV